MKRNMCKKTCENGRLYRRIFPFFVCQKVTTFGHTRFPTTSPVGWHGRILKLPTKHSVPIQPWQSFWFIWAYGLGVAGCASSSIENLLLYLCNLFKVVFFFLFPCFFFYLNLRPRSEADQIKVVSGWILARLRRNLRGELSPEGELTTAENEASSHGPDIADTVSL